MNEAHLHLVINHFPIIVPVVGLLVMIAGILLKSSTVQNTAFGIFILAAITTILAMASGEGAAELIENMKEADSSRIHDHEESAEVFAVMMYVLGILSLLGIILNRKKKIYANIISVLVLIVAATSLYFAAATGTSGGEIMHEEIRIEPKVHQAQDKSYDRHEEGEEAHEDDD